MFAAYHYVVLSMSWMLCCSYVVTRVSYLADCVYNNVLLLAVAAFIALQCRNNVELKRLEMGRRGVILRLFLLSTSYGIIFANGVIVLPPYLPLVAALASFVLVYTVALVGRIDEKIRHFAMVIATLVICVVAYLILNYMLHDDSISDVITIAFLLYQSFVMLRSQKLMHRILAEQRMQPAARIPISAFMMLSNIFLVYPQIYALNEDAS